MRFLLALPLLMLCAKPVSAQAVYLKCTRYIDHKDKGPNTPDHTWLTINPGQQYGNARFIRGNGSETNLRANQFISSTEYKLNAIQDYGSGIAEKWTFSVNRSTGILSHSKTLQTPYDAGSTNTSSGTCAKDIPVKTLF